MTILYQSSSLYHADQYLTTRQITLLLCIVYTINLHWGQNRQKVAYPFDICRQYISTGNYSVDQTAFRHMCRRFGNMKVCISLVVLKTITQIRIRQLLNVDIHI